MTDTMDTAKAVADNAASASTGSGPRVMFAGSPEHQRYRMMGWAALAVVLIITPFIMDALGWTFLVTKLNRSIALAVAILGLNLVVGYSGLLALCQSAFIGIGAFTTASLIVDENWDYWMTIPFAILLAFLVGLLLGIPALKIKGLYLAMATVAFAGLFPGLTKLELGPIDIARRTGGADGKTVEERLNAPDWVPFIDDTNNEIYRYFIILAMALATFWLISNLVKSRVGRAIISIRDNEIGAAVSGVNLRWFKVLNFGLSAGIGGLAGCMWVMNSAIAGEQEFNFNLMIDLLVGLVIGGVATISGAAIGAVVVIFGKWICQTFIDVSLFSVLVFGLIVVAGIYAARTRETTREKVMVFAGVVIGGTILQAIIWSAIDMPAIYQLDGNGPLSNAIFGIVLIVTVFFAPQGIVGALRQQRARWVQILPVPPELPEGATSISSSLDLATDK